MHWWNSNLCHIVSRTGTVGQITEMLPDQPCIVCFVVLHHSCHWQHALMEIYFLHNVSRMGTVGQITEMLPGQSCLAYFAALYGLWSRSRSIPQNLVRIWCKGQITKILLGQLCGVLFIAQTHFKTEVWLCILVLWATKMLPGESRSVWLAGVWHYCLKWHCFVWLSKVDSDVPTKTLRTSLPGETGLSPHTHLAQVLECVIVC